MYEVATQTEWRNGKVENTQQEIDDSAAGSESARALW